MALPARRGKIATGPREPHNGREEEGHCMAALSISRAWDDTKARISGEGRLLATVAAALLLLPQAVVAVVAPPQELSGVAASSWVNLLVFIAALLGIIGQLAIIRLSQVSGMSVGEAISHGLRRFLPVLGAILLLSIGVFLVTLLLVLLLGGLQGVQDAEAGAMTTGVMLAALVIVLLALTIGPKFLMMMPVAAAERGGPIHILKRSWSLSNGHYFRLLAFIFLIVVAAIVVVIATQLVAGSVLVVLFGELRPLSVGALLYALLFASAQAAFAVVIAIMLARLYSQLAEDEALEVTVPNTGT
jgi:hypothetical protein